MLSDEQLVEVFHHDGPDGPNCLEDRLRAVAEAAVKDERENRNRPMALREFAELVQKLVIIGPLTSEQGRQLMMLQEMASTTLEAAVNDAVCDWCVSDSVMAGRIMNVFGRSHDPSLEPAADPFRDKIAAMIYQHRNAVEDAVGGEPVAWEFQHEDTGLTMYECPQQVEWGFEKNNPRWKKIGPVYRRPQASAADGCRLTSYAEDGSTCTLNLNGQEIYFDRNDHVTALAASQPEVSE